MLIPKILINAQSTFKTQWILKEKMFLDIHSLQKMCYFHALLCLYSERLVQVTKTMSDPIISSDAEYWPVPELCFSLIKRMFVKHRWKMYKELFSALKHPATNYLTYAHSKLQINLPHLLNIIWTTLEQGERKTKGIAGGSKRHSGLSLVTHLPLLVVI